MKIYLDTIGCRLNQSEIESYAWQFCAAGHTLVATPSEADLAVINTCTVTAAAASDSRQKIRQTFRAGTPQIVVTGCWSTLNSADATLLPGVSRIIPNSEKDHFVADLLSISQAQLELEPMGRELIPGTRMRTRAFIKVQDGCNNRCTYCITALARGSSQSRPIKDILKDIQRVTYESSGKEKTQLDSHQASSPAQEIVLTGVHLGAWGQDFHPQQHLKNLIHAIMQNSDIKRLRLSSIEPWDIDDEFLELWENPRLCSHLHLPLQSGSETVLRRMARKITPDKYARLVESARKLIPDIAITTDVIVGFPGESEAEFNQSLAFVKKIQFSRGHVFNYSARAGTLAAKMPDQVPYQLRKERSAVMHLAFAQAEEEYKKSFVGRVMPVLWESSSPAYSEGWNYSGLSENYLRVCAHSKRQLWNQITPAKLTGKNSRGMVGIILENCNGVNQPYSAKTR